MVKIIKRKFIDKIQYRLVEFNDKCAIFKIDSSKFLGSLWEAEFSDPIATFSIKKKEKAEKFFDSL